MVTCRITQPHALPMCLGYPPGLDLNPGAGNAEEDQAPRIVMVGVSGPGGAGKSTLAEGLAEKLESPMSPIEVNWFRKTQLYTATKPDRRSNSETPESINFDMLCDHLDDIKEALLIRHKVKALEKPNERLPDTIIVVVEGCALFYNKKVCERLHVRLWVNEDANEVLMRQIVDKLSKRQNVGPDFDQKFFQNSWATFLLHLPEQLANVPYAERLQGGCTAKELLDSALQAFRKSIQTPHKGHGSTPRTVFQ